MKRVKIMLAAMAVLGTVGGVLAFKSVRITKYCIRDTVSGVCPVNATCPNGVLARFDAGGATKCYTTTAVTANCAIDAPKCTTTAKVATN